MAKTAQPSEKAEALLEKETAAVAGQVEPALETVAMETAAVASQGALDTGAGAAVAGQGALETAAVAGQVVVVRVPNANLAGLPAVRVAAVNACCR